MTKFRMIIGTIALLALSSCGRGECGYIVNDTGVPLILTLQLQNVDSDPTIYLVGDTLRSPNPKPEYLELPNNHYISYDSVNQIMKLELKENEKIKLGTVRLDMTRDSLKYWEFNSIIAVGEGKYIEANGDELIDLIEKKHSPFSQNSHYLKLK